MYSLFFSQKAFLPLGADDRSLCLVCTKIALLVLSHQRFSNIHEWNKVLGEPKEKVFFCNFNDFLYALNEPPCIRSTWAVAFFGYVREDRPNIGES